MKKIISFLCALCLVVGSLGCYQAPVKVSASEGLANKVTLVGFADPVTYDQAGEYAEVSAITSSGMSVGGDYHWSYGIVAIEPAEDVSLTQACYFYNGVASTLVATTIEGAWASLKNDTVENIPARVTAAIGSLAEDEASKDLPALYITRELYESIISGENELELQFSDGECITILFNKDSFNVFREEHFTVGDDINIIDMFKAAYPGVDFAIEDYKVGNSSTGPTSNDAVVATEDPEVYKIVMAGTWQFNLENKHNGLFYRVDFSMDASSETPIYIKDVIIPENAMFIGEVTETQTTADICPKDTLVFDSIDIIYPLKPGMTVNWDECSAFGSNQFGKRMRDNGFYSGITNRGQGEFPYTVTPTLTDDSLKLSFTSERGVDVYYTVAFDYNGATYYLTITIIFNTSTVPGTGISYPVNNSTYSYRPGAMVYMPEFLNLSASNTQTFIEWVNKGDLYLGTMTTPSLSLLFENGVFNGYAVINSPVSYMSIERKPFIQDCGYDVNMQIKTRTVVTAGSSLDFKTIIPGYDCSNRDIEVYVGNEKVENTFVNDMVFTAPAMSEGAEPVTYSVRFFNPNEENVIQAIINVTVTPASGVNDAISDIITEMGTSGSEEEDGVIIDSAFTQGSISDKIFEALEGLKKNGKENISATIKEHGNDHNVSWAFNSKGMKTDLVEKKAVKLGVTVSENPSNAELAALKTKNNLKGIELGFEDNGELPGEATVRIYLTDEEVAELGGKTHLQLYYYNEATLTKETSDYYLIKDEVADKYYIDVKVTHNSDFLLTPASEDSFEGEEIEYAEVSWPARVTAVTFADLTSFPATDALAEIKTTTGAAIAIGGNASEDYNFLVIDKVPGWSIDKIYFGPAGLNEISDEKLAGTVNYDGLLAQLTADTNGKLPTGVSALFAGHEASLKDESGKLIYDSTKAVEITRNKMYEGYITVVLVNDADSEEQVQIEVELIPAEFRDTAEINMDNDEEFDVFAAIEAEFGSEALAIGKDKFGIEIFGHGNAGSLEGGTDKSDLTTYGKFKGGNAGTQLIKVSNTVTGFTYEYDITIKQTLPMDLSDVSFTGVVFNSEYGSISPAEGQDYILDLKGSFTLPEGAGLAGILYGGVSFIDAPAEGKDFEVNSYSGMAKTPIKAFCEVSEAGLVSFEIQSANNQHALSHFLEFIIRVGDKSYNYSMQVGYNRSYGISGYGAQQYPAAVRREYSIDAFLNMPGSSKTKVIEAITNKQLELKIQNDSKPAKVELLYDDQGKFTGKFKVDGLCDYIAVGNTERNVSEYSGSLNLQFKPITVIRSGESIDLSTLLGYTWSAAYNQDGHVTVACPDGGDAYTLNENIFTAPTFNDSGVYTYEIRLKNRFNDVNAIITINVLGTGVEADEALGNIVGDLPEGGQLSLDNSILSEGGLSADVINALGNANDDSALIVTNKSHGHGIEWMFEKNGFKSNATKNIKLDATVGQELANENVDAILTSNGKTGVKLGFADNGQLPAEAKFRTYLTAAEVAQFSDPDCIYLYHFDREHNKLVREEGVYAVGKEADETAEDGYKYYIEVKLTHNSDFVLSSMDADSFEGEADPTPSNPTPSNPTPSNPTPSNPTPSNPTPSTPAPSAPAGDGGAADKTEDKTVEQKDDKTEVKEETKPVEEVKENPLAEVIEVKVENGVAKVEEFTAEATETLKAESEAVLDFSAAGEEVKAVELPASIVETLTKATTEAESNTESVKIELTNASIQLDAKTLNALAEASGGQDLSLEIDSEKTVESLNEKQQNTLAAYEVSTVISASFATKTNEIHDFGGGKVNLSIKLNKPLENDSKYYHVVYVSESGKTEYMSTSFSKGDGEITFTTTHFSDYAVIYDETRENDTYASMITGQSFARLGAYASGNGKTYVKLNWNKVAEADGYKISVAECADGKWKTSVVSEDVNTVSYKVKGLKKGGSYKFVVRAYKLIDGKKVELTKSPVIYANTDGGEYETVDEIKLAFNKVSLTVGKTSKKLKASQKSSGQLEFKRAVKYETSDAQVAVVTKSGKIKATGIGKATIYVYGQSGVCEKVDVSVQ